MLAADLPADLPAAVLIVLHMPIGVPSALPSILDRAGPLPAVAARHGMPIESGTLYICVPDRHLLMADGSIAITDGPTESRHRPSINALFRSVALHAGSRATGVILSGALDDGVSGLKAIHARGGVTIVQDPQEATFEALPVNAIEHAQPDHVVPIANVAALLRDHPRPDRKKHIMYSDHTLELENHIAMGAALARPVDSENIGPPTNYVCPDCNGGLMEVSDGNFRCRIGHAWTADALLHARSTEIDSALGMAVRSLQEKAELADGLAKKVGSGGLQDRYRRTAEESRHAAAVLRDRFADLVLGTTDTRSADTDRVDPVSAADPGPDETSVS